jgi:hypothetical protein
MPALAGTPPTVIVPRATASASDTRLIGSVCAIPDCPFSGQNVSVSFNAPAAPAHDLLRSADTISQRAQLTARQFGNVTCNSQLSPGTYQNVTAELGCTINGADDITGSLRIVDGGSLYDLGALIGGNLQANNSAWIELGGGSIGVNLLVIGLTGEPGTVTGNIDGHDYLCNTHVGGNVQVLSAEPGASFDIGSGPDGATGLTIGGNLQVQDNSAQVIVGSNSSVYNSLTGNIQLQGNTGGGNLTDNIAGGNCQLQNDQPGIVGSGNTVPAGHWNTCNTTQLAITITNLPVGLGAHVIVTEANGHIQSLSASGTIYYEGAGTWTVTAFPVADPGASDTYYPTVTTTTVQLAPGASGVVNVDYGSAVANTTRVASPGAIQSVTPPDQNGNQVVVVNDPGKALAPGDILGAGAGPATPEGLLLDVTAVTRSGGVATVTGTAGSLTDIGPEGTISAEGSYPDPQNFDDPLTCSGAASASVSGNVDFSPQVQLDMAWGGLLHPLTITARASVSGTLTPSLAANINGTASCTYETDLLPKPVVLGIIGVLVGPVPVVVVPTLNFQLEADASISGSLDTSVTQSLAMTAGLNWDGNTLTPFSSLSPSHSYEPLTQNGSGTIHAQVGPVVTINIEAIPGPFITADAHANLQANLPADLPAGSTNTPCWTLTAGVEAGGGLKFNVWGITFDQEDPAILSQDWPVAAAPCITTASLDGAIQGNPYSDTLQAMGGSGAPYSWALTLGSLLDGLSLDPSTGVISGTPTTSGVSDFEVTVTDSNGSTATGDYSLTVSSNTQTITMPATGTTALGNSGAYNVNASTNDTDPGATLVYSVGGTASNSAGCTVGTTGLVSFTAAGNCTIDVNSAATANYVAAAQAQQVLTVTGAGCTGICLVADGNGFVTLTLPYPPLNNLYVFVPIVNGEEGLSSVGCGPYETSVPAGQCSVLYGPGGCGTSACQYYPAAAPIGASLYFEVYLYHGASAGVITLGPLVGTSNTIVVQ